MAMALLQARSWKIVFKAVTWSMFSLLLYTYPQGNPPILGTTTALLLNMAWEGTRVVGADLQEVDGLWTQNRPKNK